MRIVILAHNLRGGGGISVGINLLSAIIRNDLGGRYLISIPSGCGYEQKLPKTRNYELISLLSPNNIFKRFLFEQFQIPRKVKEWKPDCILGLANMGVRHQESIPMALLCHNSYLWYSTKFFGPRTRWLTKLKIRLQKKIFAKDLKRTQLLLTQTETAYKCIRKVYGYKGQYALCPNAVSKYIKSDRNGTVPAVLRQSNFPYKLFYLTKYYTHKNIEVLLDAFVKHRNDLKFCVLYLTIDKKQHPGALKLLKNIKKEGLENQVVNLGPIPQDELHRYFRHVDALIMPTLLESFSASYLEAMYFNVPILTSDLDFAHEICHDAAVYFNPWDPTSIKDAVLRLFKDKELSSQIVRNGNKQLHDKLQSWDTIAGNLSRNLEKLYFEQTGME